jgi:hypothetical protein
MSKNTVATLRVLVAAVFIFGCTLAVYPRETVKAAPLLPNRFVRISNPTISQVAEYTVGFTVNEVATPIGSVSILFCTNTPLLTDPCVPPAGFDVSGATLTNQTGNTGFTIDSSTSNSILLSRLPILPSNAASTYQFNGVINPSASGSHFMRLRTFSSTDGTGTEIEEGGTVFVMNSGLSINTEVPPYLKLCASVTIVGFNCATATSFLIDLGELSKSQANTATSELVIATNAGFGYTITIAGTTLTSGNNIIDPLSGGGTSSPGTAQFGINLRANSNPGIGADPSGPGIAAPTANYNIPNNFRFINPDVIVSGSGNTDNKKFTVSYLVNVAVNQPPGVYATTLTYIALANF